MVKSNFNVMCLLPERKIKLRLWNNLMKIRMEVNDINPIKPKPKPKNTHNRKKVME